MVKSIIAIIVSALVIAFSAFFEWGTVNRDFSSFSEELAALTQKLENGTAGEEDAKAVQTSWERRKKSLHVWIPHNDVSRIDDYMSETVHLVGEGETALAIAKIGIMQHLTECLPDTYKPHIDNIF